jgi:HPt (histidine-containing phosphotransfer) domain-containing protein
MGETSAHRILACQPGQDAGGAVADGGPEPAGSAAGLLDPAMVAEMIETCGAELLLELAESLQAEGAEILADLARSSEAGDARAAARLLHSVRGAALGVGCAAFGAAAQEHETAALAGVVPARAAIEGLGSLLALSVADLRRAARLRAA